jgi:4-hydroxyphenylpyruvate dioxygenase
MLDELRRRTGAPLPGAAPLPPPATCRGVEFVEMAVDDAAGMRLETVLRGLGFAPSARHRSKAVERWSQGGINIVVNREKEGFAHSFLVTHGPSVCAVALKVDDAAACADRATALLDEPFRQPVGPGELDIPAVRGVAGSLLYFVDRKNGLDRLWDIDFERFEEPEAAVSAGLLVVDHLSQAMRYEEMLSWLLFYRSLLEGTTSPVQDVIDPGGVVQSQVVETTDGSLKVVLNASQSHQTLASRFISEGFGGGVQHVAFATADIFATVDHLQRSGIEFLPIPENYYDDLEARTDLSEEIIGRIRQGNILYDREGAAEFFHAYARPVLEGGFFFEIVERRGGYRGFGAVNAPVRLAAQSGLLPPPGMPRVG